VLTVLDRDLSVEWPIGTLITDWVLKKIALWFGFWLFCRYRLCDFFPLFWLCSQVYIIPDLALGFVENAGNPGFGLE